MKRLLEKVIQKKNPQFYFDKTITLSIVLELLIEKLVSWIRGYKLLISGNYNSTVFLGKNVSFFAPRNIRFGKFNSLGDYCYVSALGKGSIQFGNNCSIGAFSRLIISTTFQLPGSHIQIGHNVGIGEFAYLGGAGGLTIGDDVIVGQYFSCHPENHIYQNPNTPIRLQGTTRKGITIGNNCWIGSKVTILDGVQIGNNCVIAAGAVVTKSFPDNSIIGGVPARLLKNNSIITKVA